ncbi:MULTISPECIES: hypothetical protein [Legionella]|uniref:Uncharacterized protein n=1 Tax=Legionella resiliens TaxID=2905958 RepID=A0ABS8WY52_9GAMM|nr:MULTISPECIES: hypothetical protein [unclassified Legionella]MCE0722246.1 hypothetical protein [Legionella sp. 9fVS26]MCE3531400.1 hypothetical protein [Legionella sp. 8cVS16]QLZ67417.1 hypothetical protein FOLKNPGA_00182 [Legionella sp. PC1000]
MRPLFDEHNTNHAGCMDIFCDPVAEVTGIINKIGNNKMTQINALLGEIKKQSSE